MDFCLTRLVMFVKKSQRVEAIVAEHDVNDSFMKDSALDTILFVAKDFLQGIPKPIWIMGILLIDFDNDCF